MDHQILLLGLNADLVKAFTGVDPVWRISKALLIAKVLFNLGVNLFDGRPLPTDPSPSERTINAFGHAFYQLVQS